jgi:hypothetical protein
LAQTLKGLQHVPERLSDQWTASIDAYVAKMIENGSDSDLVELAEHLGIEPVESATAPVTDLPRRSRGIPVPVHQFPRIPVTAQEFRAA